MSGETLPREKKPNKSGGAATETRQETGAGFGTVDCGAVLGSVLSSLKMEIEESNAAVIWNDLTTVTADETQLIQLFRNLISNALKYRSGRPPRIHVSAKPVRVICGLKFEDPRMQSAIHDLYSASGKGWLFSVTDNGVGIDPLNFDRIFETVPCLHADEINYPGRGAGLTACREIVTKHNGRIWVDSEPGLGSTFYFTIP